MGERHERNFTKADIDMANKHMRKCSASLAIREIQIKTTTQYHLTPVGMGKINKAGNHKCWRRCGERRALLHCWWECEVIQPLWKTVWRFLDEWKIELPQQPWWLSGLALPSLQGVILESWEPVSYTHLTLPTTCRGCRSRWSPYH